MMFRRGGGISRHGEWRATRSGRPLRRGVLGGCGGRSRGHAERGGDDLFAVLIGLHFAELEATAKPETVGGPRKRAR